ncbi:MAG: TrmH family RNA methyltransferase [Oligoflexales bacterium]
MHHITSLQNPEIKELISLRTSRKRRRAETILVEGEREIRRALLCGFNATHIYWCPEKISDPARQILEELNYARNRSLSEACYEKVAIRDDSDGIIVLFKEDLKIQEEKFHSKDHKVVLILDHIEKPGNVGALLRSADGSGVNAVIVIGGCDTFSANTIRTSLGTVFHLPIQNMTLQQCADWCKAKALHIILADPGPSAVPYHNIDWSKPAALVIGNEAKGLSNFWKNISDTTSATIPMRGIADSLNASVAGAIMMYEATKHLK